MEYGVNENSSAVSRSTRKKLGKAVGLHEIGYETMWFMHEDIDEEMVPLNIISKLVEPIVCDSANYTDDEGD